ncbi:arsenate reductase (glutaredoxin) [Acetobacter lambici]|uniref:Arsenate reductase n=1 Tax=Acetobacter lambici TaxID=1332824 RepID=A0ABT1F0R9_9PROT|nr:arsenate reductase (glutaredoxin) [Acetobacter lambici]MCP1242581.1 arsenate reductase (glutaredoxin) [Acetobacter lambici]MCP1258802.1 arsenate reductase (glutaredoxin) [Acetobacter lambici]NHO57010.1 arsenate reductase (glutaredoxin) [Acetobacter lambici]
MTVTVYHNPSCGTSRSVLELVRNAGIEPEVVLYLKTPPSRKQLEDTLLHDKLGARDLLRAKEKLCAELGLDKPDVTDSQILDAIAQHPALLNRPVVVTPKGAKACRPATLVLDLLP